MDAPSYTCLCDSSRCFMSTATTTLTKTNWAIKTKMTKKMGAMMRETQQFFIQSAEGSQFSRSVSFMMPFQLSPVATRKSVKKAIPKLAKCACSPSPWQGWSSSHSVIQSEGKKRTRINQNKLSQATNVWSTSASVYVYLAAQTAQLQAQQR